MAIINMTPHPVVVVTGDDGLKVARFESAGQIRLAACTEPAGDIEGILTVATASQQSFKTGHAPVAR